MIDIDIDIDGDKWIQLVFGNMYPGANAALLSSAWTTVMK